MRGAKPACQDRQVSKVLLETQENVAPRDHKDCRASLVLRECPVFPEARVNVV